MAFFAVLPASVAQRSEHRGSAASWDANAAMRALISDPDNEQLRALCLRLGYFPHLDRLAGRLKQALTSLVDSKVPQQGPPDVHRVLEVLDALEMVFSESATNAGFDFDEYLLLNIAMCPGFEEWLEFNPY